MRATDTTPGSAWHHRAVVRVKPLAAALLVGALAACTRGFGETTESLTSPSASTPAPTASPSPSRVGRPAIVVRVPVAQGVVRSPVTVSGTAYVFEGVVSIRILDAEGNELAAINALASCGAGCRGRFRARVAFFVEFVQPGTIQVFEVSQADGSALNLVEIPVRLAPLGG